jgi:GNAT superfamily N-acetyltransferase
MNATPTPGPIPEPGFELRLERYDSPIAQALIAAVQEEYTERYGGPDDSPIDADEFEAPAGLFLVGYLGGEPVATGGLRRHGDGEVEIKRMYVARSARGRGLSRLVLAELERRARGLGATRIVLETGMRQPEAIALYESSGYEPIPGFGHYQRSPLSRTFGKGVPGD